MLLLCKHFVDHRSFTLLLNNSYRLCTLVVRVPTNPEVPGSIPSATRFFKTMGLERDPLRERSRVVVKALCYKPDGRWFGTRWGEWILSGLTRLWSFAQSLTEMSIRDK
jgi:hypothetical protein